MKRLLAYLIIMIMLSSSVLGIWWVKESPPGIAPGTVCLIGDVCDYGNGSIYGGTYINSILYNVTIWESTYINVNFMNFTGHSYYNGFNIYDVGIINADYLTGDGTGITEVCHSDGTNCTTNMSIEAEYILNPFWVNKSGDTMSGDLNMGGNDISNIDSVNANSFTGDGSGITNIQADNVEDIWVNESGDTMTGNLSMNNNSILNVWELNVHNITGNSPIYVSDDMIISNDIYVENIVHATTYIGTNITFYDSTNTTPIMVLSPTNYPGFGDDWGDITARTITVDRLLVTGLLNYSELEPPDYYFADEVWIHKELINGTTYIFEFNGTHLDEFVNSSIEEQTGIFEENVTITVTGGVGTGVTTNCCSGSVEVLNIKVSPATLTTQYKFSANTTSTGQVIDTDRKIHTGDWEIAHRGSIVINENINYYITNANIDENFTIRVRYRQ